MSIKQSFVPRYPSIDSAGNPYQVNEGYRFEPTDGVKADDMNAIAEAALWAAQTAQFVAGNVGFIGFQVVNGELKVNYSGNSQPNMSINSNGELIYNI